MTSWPPTPHTHTFRWVQTQVNNLSFQWRYMHVLFVYLGSEELEALGKVTLINLVKYLWSCSQQAVSKFKSQRSMLSTVSHSEQVTVLLVYTNVSNFKTAATFPHFISVKNRKKSEQWVDLDLDSERDRCVCVCVEGVHLNVIKSNS